MKAMVLERLAPLVVGRPALALRELEQPQPGPEQLLLRVIACGVCHTEIDQIEGRVPPAHLPMVPGHQVVAEVVAGSGGPPPGSLVGVAWIHSACGSCAFCRQGRENLCPDFQATGRDAPGGYAEYLLAPVEFVHPLPRGLEPLSAAPLLCAGAVGWRALELCRLADGQPLGLAGFGASNHLVLQLARHRFPQSPIMVFARNAEQRRLARELGASWCGDFDQVPPQAPFAIIDTTPAWRPVLECLRRLAPGGRLVINAIGKEDADRQLLAELDYREQLWQEREIKTVANVTRADVRRCLQAASDFALNPVVETLPLEQANEALWRLRAGGQRGALVLCPE